MLQKRVILPKNLWKREVQGNEPKRDVNVVLNQSNSFFASIQCRICDSGKWKIGTARELTESVQPPAVMFPGIKHDNTHDKEDVLIRDSLIPQSSVV